MSTTSEHGGDQLTIEEIHDILSNQRRHAVLEILQDQQQITVRSLSKLIAEQECGPDEQPNRQSVYVSLHQTHLPKLDDSSLINYDQDRQVVSPCQIPPRVKQLLDMKESKESRVDRKRIGVVGITAAIVFGYGYIASTVTLLVFSFVWLLLSGTLILITD